MPDLSSACHSPRAQDGESHEGGGHRFNVIGREPKATGAQLQLTEVMYTENDTVLFHEAAVPNSASIIDDAKASSAEASAAAAAHSIALTIQYRASVGKLCVEFPSRLMLEESDTIDGVAAECLEIFAGLKGSMMSSSIAVNQSTEFLNAKTAFVTFDACKRLTPGAASPSVSGAMSIPDVLAPDSPLPTSSPAAAVKLRKSVTLRRSRSRNRSRPRGGGGKSGGNNNASARPRRKSVGMLSSPQSLRRQRDNGVASSADSSDLSLAGDEKRSRGRSRGPSGGGALALSESSSSTPTSALSSDSNSTMTSGSCAPRLLMQQLHAGIAESKRKKDSLTVSTETSRTTADNLLEGRDVLDMLTPHGGPFQYEDVPTPSDSGISSPKTQSGPSFIKSIVLPLDTLRDELDQFLKRGFGVDSALYTFAIGVKVQSHRSKLLHEQYTLATAEAEADAEGAAAECLVAARAANRKPKSKSKPNRKSKVKRNKSPSASASPAQVAAPHLAKTPSASARSSSPLSRNDSDDALSQQGEATPNLDSDHVRAKKSPRSAESTLTPPPSNVSAPTEPSTQSSFTSISLPSSFFGFGRCASTNGSSSEAPFVSGGVNTPSGASVAPSSQWKWVMVSLTAVNVGLLAAHCYMRLREGRVVSKVRRS